MVTVSVRWRCPFCWSAACIGHGKTPASPSLSVSVSVAHDLFSFSLLISSLSLPSSHFLYLPLCAQDSITVLGGVVSLHEMVLPFAKVVDMVVTLLFFPFYLVCLSVVHFCCLILTLSFTVYLFLLLSFLVCLSFSVSVFPSLHFSPPSYLFTFTTYRGFSTRLVYLHYISCLRYTILVGNPQYKPIHLAWWWLLCWKYSWLICCCCCWWQSSWGGAALCQSATCDGHSSHPTTVWCPQPFCSGMTSLALHTNFPLDLPLSCVYWFYFWTKEGHRI